MAFREVEVRVVHRFCGLVVLGAALSSADATAQPAGKPATAAVSPADAARPRYEKGRVYENAGKLELAYGEYAEAYKLYAHWQIAGTLGGVALKLGKHREAAEKISQFLGQAEGLSVAERNEKLKQLEEARSRIGTLAFEVAGGSEVFVDGRSVGRAPLPADVYVDPGEHEVEAKKAGVSTKAKVDIGAGKREVVKLRYGGAAETEPVENGGGVGPAANGGVADAKAGGTAGASSPFTMSTSSPGAPEQAQGSGRSAVLGLGITLLVLGGIGGATTGGLALVRSDERDQALGKQGQWDSLEKERYWLSNTAGWCFVGAGVGLATTLATVLFWPSESKPSAMIRVRPTGLGGDVSVMW